MRKVTIRKVTIKKLKYLRILFLITFFLSPTFGYSANTEKQNQIEQLFRHFESAFGFSSLIPIHNIQNIDDFFMKEGNKPFQIYPNNTEKQDELLQKVLKVIRSAPFLEAFILYETGIDEDLFNSPLNGKIKAFKLLRFFSFKQRKKATETIQLWIKESENPYEKFKYEHLEIEYWYLMASLSEGPFHTSSEEGISNILDISISWSFNQLIPTSYNSADSTLGPGLPFYVDVIEQSKLEAQDISELLKRAKTPEENYFVMVLIATFYSKSVNIQMIPSSWSTNHMIPEVSYDAVFAVNFQNTPDYSINTNFPPSRWLENNELRKQLEDLVQFDSKIHGILSKNSNPNVFIALNAIRALSYGTKTESTTKVIHEFITLLDEHEDIIWPQLRLKDGYYGRGAHLYSKFYLAFSYIIYHGWEGLPKVIEWLSLRKEDDKFFIPRRIGSDLIEIVVDMASIDIPPEAHSYYFDFFNAVFRNCNLWTQFNVESFEKGLKNINNPQKAAQLKNKFETSCSSN